MLVKPTYNLFITLNLIRLLLKYYSRVRFVIIVLYSNTFEIFLLNSTWVNIFISLLYSTRVVKFHYFTQDC